MLEKSGKTLDLPNQLNNLYNLNKIFQLTKIVENKLEKVFNFRG